MKWNGNLYEYGMELEKGIYGVKNGKRNRVERSIQCHAPTFYSILFRRERILVFFIGFYEDWAFGGFRFTAPDLL
jgi:hypothetical protein